MARREIFISDLSGREIAEEDIAKMTVSDHPALGNRTVELDAAVDEVESLESSKINLVSVGIQLPGQSSVRRVVLEVDAFNRLFGETNVEEALRNARSGGSIPRPAGRRRSGGGSGGSGGSGGRRVDYTDKEKFGQLHRGRVNEEEAALVRGNLEQANRNRAAAGQPPIDPSDPKDQKRYGL